jgi:hypothetical protein
VYCDSLLEVSVQNIFAYINGISSVRLLIHTEAEKVKFVCSQYHAAYFQNVEDM